MRFALLTCVLYTAACGASDTPPAQSATSMQPIDTSTNGAASPALSASAQAPARTTSNAAVATAPVQDTATPLSGAPASHSDATVIDNPGAHDHTPNADNTKNNDRDRHGTLTPMNQGNGADEIKITAAVRKGLMGDKSLSFTAKNVKIITIGTKVTLRGVVKSDDEKASIETRAKQTSGVTDVDNQLEVKK